MSVVPFAWRDRKSLIERLLPAQKISAEAQKERKAGAGQTLTALGSYWKGRKPLILVKACVLGALLPVTEDAEADLSIFEKLMAIDDEAFLRRGFRPSCEQLVERLSERGELSADEAAMLFEVRMGKEILPFQLADLENLGKGRFLQWKKDAGHARHELELRWVQSFSYLERVAGAKRPEELDQEELFAPVWDEVNQHLGTNASSFPALMEQLGAQRFGKRPRVGDTFCGGGSIPFEAARMGCDVHASDMSPIACMLTWGAINIIGADPATLHKLEKAQREIAGIVDREICRLGIEHDSDGNRAKVFLYCLETRCPQTGWMVPLAPSWVLSTTRNVIAKLVPTPETKSFRIDVVTGVDASEMEAAAEGTTRDGDLVYQLDGETYRTPLKTIRGDYRLADKSVGNNLRQWQKQDFAALPGDIFRERLYCIQWITRDSVGRGRQETYFASVTDADLAREEQVAKLVADQLNGWQLAGLVPDMVIEPGEKTDEPIRTRGWTHWHHLFNARQLHFFAQYMAHLKDYPECEQGLIGIKLASLTDYVSRLVRWTVASAHKSGGGREVPANVFSNQALNTLYNYASRSWGSINSIYYTKLKPNSINVNASVKPALAKNVANRCDIFITDPPYADAVYYHEITEYFIAWLRKNPPTPFQDWVWDSRRTLAIKGSGDDFRRDMIAAYSAMAQKTPDNGLQIVMFTHTDAGVWADMASIVWGAGLQVTAAWYIATETTSELKKGGYVQGTVLLVMRKRLQQQSVYRDELVQEVRAEVAQQIETMTGLNQFAKGAGRSENLFEDQDLQMAGYAAALRVLTGYSRIDGQDMAAEALRPKQSGGRDLVKDIIDFAVQVANEHLVSEQCNYGT